MYTISAFSVASRRAAANAFPAVSVSSRHTPTRLYTSTMHDNNPDLLESEKQKNLAGIQHKTSTPHSHAPGWNEDLASASEASIKADGSHGTPEELQRRTIEYIHSRHSPEERSEPTNASYSHDTVSGPLSDAAGVQEVLEKRTVREETTKVLKERSVATDSEANVRADRGEA